MNVCKEFMQHIRKVSYKDVYLLLDSDIFPHLTECVRLLSDIKFEDGSYHVFYGYNKKYITSFMIYWKIAIDDIIQEADKYTYCSNKEEIMELMDRTIDIHQSRQIAFGKGFLPVQSPLEKQVYDEIEELFKQYMERLYELKVHVEKLDKQDKVNDFAKVHFKITVQKTNEIFEATHTFIALMLADRLNNIGVSLEEILQRLKNNLRSVQEECDEKLYELLHEMYDKNKELLLISRQDRRSSVECAEAGRSIDRVREKIEYSNYSNPSLSRLEEEVAYWQTRLNEFRECADKLMRLKKDQEDVMKQEQTYNSMKTTELPGSRKQCWLNIGENFAQRRDYLKARIIEVAKTLVTFFAAKGADRILYTDDVGLYYIDEFNHQVYVFDYSLRFYHTNCEGEFREVSDQVNYYFDKFGRYIKGEEGEKIYQLASCTSQYKVQANTNLLTKVTEDCGHSEKPNQKCHQRIKDPTRPGEVLPHVEKVDLKSTLTPEVVKYLWDSFGHILPYALRDVGRDRTKNPIQHLAHKILQYKYNRTKDEIRHEMKEAEDYRANIFKERKERAMEASKAWKSKQVKRRKPEESDDADDRVVRDVQATEHAIVDSMYYYDNYD